MSGSEDDDQKFQRMLLASARQDAAPGDGGVADAWTRFAGALRALSPVAVGSGVTPPARPRIGRAMAVKWLVVGALGGTGVTAAVMSARAPAPRPALSAPAVPAPPAAAVSRPSSAEPAPELAAPVRDRPPLGAERRGARAPHLGSAPPASTLAAEVARIETARTAAAVGDYDEAIRLVGRYHRDFPDGVLAPDADVVALEAWAAKGDGAETARQAALFLSRYPNDPHARRVRLLAAQPAGRN